MIDASFGNSSCYEKNQFKDISGVGLLRTQETDHSTVQQASQLTAKFHGF